MAEKRLNSLKVRLKKDLNLHVKYQEGIKDYIEKQYASQDVRFVSQNSSATIEKSSSPSLS